MYNIYVASMPIPPAVGTGFECILLLLGLSINKEYLEKFFSSILVIISEIIIVEKNKVNNIR